MTSPKITLGRETYALVRGDTLDAPDESRARRLVQHILDEDPGAGRRIVALAESLTGEWSMTVADAVATVSRAIARGDLVVLRERTDDDALHPSDIQPHDLRDVGDDPVVPVGPGGGGRDAPAPMTRTWISFEVVDDRGQPMIGEFRVAIDADEDSGRTEDGRRFYDDVRAEADARLRLDLLQWEVGPRDGPGVVPTDGPDVPVSPHEAEVTTVEVVDEQGRAWAGAFAIVVGGEVTESGDVSELAGRELDGEGLSLSLSELRPGGSIEMARAGPSRGGWA